MKNNNTEEKKNIINEPEKVNDKPAEVKATENKPADGKPAEVKATVLPVKLSKELDTIRIKAAAYCTAVNDGKMSKDDVDGLKKAVNDAVADYNDAAAKLAYDSWKTGGDPVHDALMKRFIPYAKTCSFSASKDTGKTTYTIRDKQMKVDLLHMEGEIGSDAFHDKKWYEKCQSLAYMIANALNKALGEDPSFAYGVSEAAKSLKLSSDASTTSVKSMVKCLQVCVDAMSFEDNGKGENKLKVTSRHWAYVRESMTKQGKRVGQVAIYNTTKMAELVADVAHLIITDSTTTLVEE